MKVRAILGGLLMTAVVAGGSALAAAPAQAAGVSSATVCEETVTVNESNWNVNTGCQLQGGDRVTLTAAGSIWAGVWFTGRNGPQGWNNIAYDSKFPMPTARAYSLLANTNGWYRYVGTGSQFTYFGGGSPLYLRINDDSPGNGDGAFEVQVQVAR